VIVVRRPTAGTIIEHDHIEAEIARIRLLAKDALREEWRSMFGREVPKALTKDLLARMLAWNIQEKAFGGFDRVTLKILDGYTRGKQARLEQFRRLKPGTEIVREYQGERHTVTVTPDGFDWRGTTYTSLTTIARTITGTNWNGPRFFGLRNSGDDVGREAAFARNKTGGARRGLEASK
jgi:Protein of unknown function (DUF2924)